MKNIELIYKSNKTERHSQNNSNKIYIKSSYIGSREIYYIIEHINWMRNAHISEELYIKFNSSFFKDGAVICVLEAVFYYCVKFYKINIKYEFNKSIRKSALYQTSLLNKYHLKTLTNKYCLDFCAFDVSKTYIRFIFENGWSGEKTSIAVTNINTFLKGLLISEDLRDSIYELSSELLNNCQEHSDADCLVKIVICPIEDRFTKEKNQMIYINFISFSKINIETKLLQAINQNDFISYSGGEIVKAAYENHKKLFDDNYDASDFSMISIFQKNVSTRKQVINSGGKGLTTFIKHLHGKTIDDDHTQSYVLNGNKSLHFYSQYLNINDDGTIGFNEENNYFEQKPCDKVFFRKNLFFPGIIYNIGIAYIEEENYDE